MPTQTRYASKDAMMGKQIVGGTFSGWNGQDNHLPVGVSAGGSYKFRCVVYFNIDFSVMKSIDSAVLTLYNNDDGSNLHCFQALNFESDLRISRVTKDWAEGSTDPGEGKITSTLSYDWDNRSESYTTNNQVSVNNISQDESNGEPLNINVTGIVNDWFAGSANNGFMIRNVNETSANYGVQFFSRSASNSSYRPKLVITYTENTPPDRPTLVSPVDSSSVATNTPTFVVASNDDDENDYITAVRVIAREPLYRYIYNASTAFSDPALPASSGYWSFGSGSYSTSIFLSKTDIDGRTLDTAKLNQSLIIHSTDETAIPRRSALFSKFSSTAIPVVDMGNWVRAEYSAKFPIDGAPVSSECAYPSAYDWCVIYPLDTFAWDTGTLAISNAPTEASVNYGTSGTVNSYNPLLPARLYLWQAATRDSALEWSPFSYASFFTFNNPPNAPQFSLSSTPSTELGTLYPTFSIVHSDNDQDDNKAYGYRIVIERTDATETPIDTLDVSLASPYASFLVTSASPLTSWGATYRARALTRDSSGLIGPFSDWVPMGTYKTKVPSGLSPSNTSAPRTATLSGQVGGERDIIQSVSINYRPKSSSSSTSISSAAISYTNTSFSYTFPDGVLSESTIYEWQASITGQIGGQSNYSEWKEFTTSSDSDPKVTAPVGNIETITPSITVTRATNFDSLLYQITDVEANSVIYTSSYIGVSPASTTHTTVYGGTPALSWGNQYFVRAFVGSAGAYSPWSGISNFKPAVAAPPSAYSVDSELISLGEPWVTSTSPYLKFTSPYDVNFAQFQVADTNNTIIWDSGMSAATSNFITSAYHIGITTGVTLSKGEDYNWRARYRMTGSGRESDYSQFAKFRINKEPFAADDLNVVAGPGSINPVFYATFSDADKDSRGDSPSKWTIQIKDATTNSQVAIKDITSGLESGKNEYYWNTSDTTLSKDVSYNYVTWFADQKGAIPDSSSYSIFPFILSDFPNGQFTIPSENFTGASMATDNTQSPTLYWTYSGGEFKDFAIIIDEVKVEDNGDVTVKNGTRRRIPESQDNFIAAPAGAGGTYSYTVPTGYFTAGKRYRIQLVVRNNQYAIDPTPSTTHLYINLNAPDPITGVDAVADGDGRYIEIDWDTVSIGKKFLRYNIYRRLLQDKDWSLVTSIHTQSTGKYRDWYAGNSLMYSYKVTVVASTTQGGNAELESGEGESTVHYRAILDEDVWTFIPNNRSKDLTMELPVIDSSYNKIIQQESFETLGSNRKLIIRGFVLGDEGSITCVWESREISSPGDSQVKYDETIIGRRFLNYITTNKGPHILKSPFGEVWDVQFEGPEIAWAPGGILQASISWVETGKQYGGSI